MTDWSPTPRPIGYRDDWARRDRLAAHHLHGVIPTRRRIEICIPMRDRHDLTAAAIAGLVRGWDYDVLRIFDNGSKDPETKVWLNHVVWTPGVEVLWRPNSTIYGMWNEAWRLAAGTPGTHLAILNNDIIMHKGTMRALSDALDRADPHIWITYPNYHAHLDQPLAPTGELTPTWGTRNGGGMSGFAFMIDADMATDDRAVPWIDESFEWLCGDGDLVEQVQARGGQCARVEGVPLEHVGQATSDQHRWTKAASARDRVRRLNKYGG